MNKYLLPPWGEPKGSTIRHKSPIRPISPKDTLPHLGGIERGFFPPLWGLRGALVSTDCATKKACPLVQEAGFSRGVDDVIIYPVCS